MAADPYNDSCDREFLGRGVFHHSSLTSTVRASLDPNDVWTSDFPAFAHEVTHFYETIGTADGLRLLCLRSLRLATIQKAVEHAARVEAGTIHIPLRRWLLQAQDRDSLRLLATMSRIEQTWDYLYGNTPRRQVNLEPPDGDARFGYYLDRNYQPVRGIYW